MIGFLFCWFNLFKQKAAEVASNSTKASVGNLAEGKDYEFRVIAVNKGGPSEASETSRSQMAKSRFGKLI